MRLVFAGTPEFAQVALAALHAAGHEVVLVLTQPDRPAGRGMKLQASAVKQRALELGLPVAQPRSLRLDGKYPEDAQAARQLLESARADAMVVVAYGLILPQWVLDVPRHGCFNIHGSLLPRWRGAAPIHRAIEAGDARTGVTIMQMDAGLDTGDMLLSASVPIGPQDRTGSLHDTLAALGARLMVEVLQQVAAGQLRPVPQPAEGITYAHKLEKHEAVVDWSLPVAAIGQRIRAFDPFPVAQTSLTAEGKTEAIKLWSYEIHSTQCPPALDKGHILAVSGAGIDVVCGDGVLRITELQRAGGKRLPVADFLRGFRLAPGMVFGQAAPGAEA